MKAREEKPRYASDYDEVTSQELFAIVTGNLGEIERAAEDLRDAAARLAR